jgi:ribosome-binding protein aMBF1 (putative translation factor)
VLVYPAPTKIKIRDSPMPVCKAMAEFERVRNPRSSERKRERVDLREEGEIPRSGFPADCCARS